MTIRTPVITYLDAYLEVTRGDTIIIPIEKLSPENSTLKSQIRQTPDSVDYFDLEISEGKVIISPIISVQLEGEYVIDVEQTFEGVVTTIQRNTLNFTPDVTR